MTKCKCKDKGGIIPVSYVFVDELNEDVMFVD